MTAWVPRPPAGSVMRRLILGGTARRRGRLEMQLEQRAMSVWGPRIPPTVGKKKKEKKRKRKRRDWRDSCQQLLCVSPNKSDCLRFPTIFKVRILYCRYPEAEELDGSEAVLAGHERRRYRLPLFQFDPFSPEWSPFSCVDDGVEEEEEEEAAEAGAGAGASSSAEAEAEAEVSRILAMMEVEESGEKRKALAGQLKARLKGSH